VAQSFKLKLQKLSDEEFSEIMVNRDLFTGKKLLLLDQEARNRYFTNKEFNGENDVYVNPDVTIPIIDKRTGIYLATSIAGALLIVALFFLVPRYIFTERPDELAVAETEAQINQQETTKVNESGNYKPEEQKKLVPSGEDKENTASSLTKEGISATQSAAPSTIIDKPIENQESAIEKKTQEVNQPIQNDVIKQEPEKVIPPKEAEEKKTLLPDESKKNTPKTDITTNEDQGKNQPGDGSEVKSDLIKEQQPSQEEHSPTESKVASETPHLFKITELSTEHLRQLVKFQNEWAHKQTTVKGVVDYYVDGNVAIKFILSQPYSDSLNQYQRRLVPNLTGKYWKDLEKELGEKFPKTPMQITFVRFDTEL